MMVCTLGSGVKDTVYFQQGILTQIHMAKAGQDSLRVHHVSRAKLSPMGKRKFRVAERPLRKHEAITQNTS
jgi:hypothetical protein